MRAVLSVIIGLCGATALIAGLSVGERYFQLHPLGRRKLSAVFALMSAVCGAWCVFFGPQVASQRQTFAIVGMVALTAMFAWAALGAACEWPGFRPELEPDPDEIEDSLYDHELDG